MEANTPLLSSSPRQEIVTERIFNFPSSLLYKAWTDPEHLKRWWGPNGFSNTFHEYDLRPGGKWSFVMHGPQGMDYPNECVFIEIEEGSMLAWNHLSEPQFQIVARFQTLAEERSKVVFKMVFPSQEKRDRILDFVKAKNEENMDRLEAELNRMAL